MRDAELRRRAIWLSQHPLRQVLDTGTEGPLGDMAMNGRIHPLAAALALAQFKELPRRLARRRRACLRLSQRLQGLPGIVPVEDPKDGRHAFHRYSPTVTAEFVTAVDLLAAQGFPVHRGYIRRPLHLREPFRKRYREGDLPQAERRCRTSLGIDADWSCVSFRWVDQLADAFTRVFGGM